MTLTLDIKQGEVFAFPTGVYTFVEEEHNNIAVFRRQGTGFRLPIPEHKLEKMLASGKARKIDFMSASSPEETGTSDNADFGPNEEWIDDNDQTKGRTPEAQRARALQFYTRKWDEDGRKPLGKVGLQELIDTWRKTAVQLKLEPGAGETGYRVQPARLKYAVLNCGTTGDRPVRVFRSRRGKAPKKCFSTFVEDALDESVRFYWSLRTRTYHDTQAHFIDKLIGPEKKRLEKQGKTLTFPARSETLRRRINAAASFVTWEQKYSTNEAYRKFKGTKASLHATKPLELVIMDHTKIDAWTVLDTETFLPLGRPWLTVAIDVATRMILGYLVTFEPASLYSVLTTLKRVNKNKSYVKSVFPHIQEKWNAWGKPAEILVDNGWEFKSPSLQDALHDLGTDIIWAPIHTPQYKAIGERFFGTLNTKLFHRLPGGVPYDVKTMRQIDLDPAKDAVLTLGDMDALIHEAIIDNYQMERHEGLGAVPARIWRDKIRLHKRPFIRDIKALNALLGRVNTATLSRDGITFKNMQFHDHQITGDLLDELVRFEKKRSQSDKTFSSGRVRVKIKWNPIDASSIEVWNHAGSPRPHYVTLPNDDPKFFNNLSFWHWDRICEFGRQEDENFSPAVDRWAARNRLREHWEGVFGVLNMRETRDARRGLAQSQGTYDDKTTNDDFDLDIEDIEHGEADPSTEGMEEATYFRSANSSEDEIAAHEREDDGAPPKGKVQPVVVRKKVAATKRANKQAAKEKDEAAEQRERQGKPTGRPAFQTKQRSASLVPDDLPRGEGWGDKPADDVVTFEEAVHVDTGIPLPSGEGWD